MWHAGAKMGGTVDPNTGEVVWEMHVPLADQLAHYRAHPPRAIAALRASSVDVDFAFDGHGEPVNAVFELACPCGSTRFVAVAGIEDGEVSTPGASQSSSTPSAPEARPIRAPPSAVPFTGSSR